MLVRWMMRRALRDVPVWVQVVVVAALLAYAGWYIFLRMPLVTLVGYNHTNYPIISYWINDNWSGLNKLYYEEFYESNSELDWDGWSGTSCCWPVNSNIANVLWTVDVTPENHGKGLEEGNRVAVDLEMLLRMSGIPLEEERSATLSMPERTREDRYLHVHFLPDNRVQLVWSSSFSSPLAERLNREYSGTIEWSTQEGA